MLDPRDRSLLLDALRPPPGYALDRAVGTTFTLDLLALLTVPLAFTFFSWDEQPEEGRVDPILLLEALRRNADRMALFCQAGQIAVPPRDQLLFSYLEQSVVEVMAPRRGGIFHPKVWALRYEDRAEDRSARYRLLVLTRNLTFDRSWDTLFTLEGELTDRTYAFSANHPLGDFLAALPDLAVAAVPAHVRDHVELVHDEIRRVRFELPAGFEELRFWSLGLEESSDWPFKGRADRMLVVAPFLGDGLLKRLGSDGSAHLLISRLEAVEKLQRETLRAFSSVYQLSPSADIEARDEQEPEADLQPLAEGEDPGGGLHAKLYVADVGWDARVWTGSANATAAAFHANVEFLVELRGKRSRCGIEAILDRDDEDSGLFQMLEEIPLREEPPPELTAEEQLQESLRKAQLDLVRVPLVARVEDEAGQAGEEEAYGLRIQAVEVDEFERPDLPGELEIACWPSTRSEAVAAQPLELGDPVAADFGRVSLEALTSFFGFRLRLTGPEGVVESRFLRNLPLLGAPPDRAERILHHVLKDRKDVLRFLLLLLSRDDWVEELGASTGGGAWLPWRGGFGGGSAVPLLETMLRALDRDPSRLDEVARFLEDLSRTEGGKELLPEGLEAIWPAIWGAREGMGS